MNQTTPADNPHAPGPPGEFTDYAIAALLANIAVIPLLAISIMLNGETPALALIIIAIAVQFAGSFTFTLALVEQNWQRPHWALCAAYLPSVWISTAFLFLIFVVLTNKRFQWSDQIIISAFFTLLAVISVMMMRLVRSLRSEAAIIPALVLPLLLFLADIALILYFQSTPGPDSAFHDIFWVFVLFISIAQFLPLIGALIYLRKTNLWGTRHGTVHTCFHCRYDLTGSAKAGQSACPECGTPIPTTQQNWIKNTL